MFVASIMIINRNEIKWEPNIFFKNWSATKIIPYLPPTNSPSQCIVDLGQFAC
jgi:hypothetical protein